MERYYRVKRQITLHLDLGRWDYREHEQFQPSGFARIVHAWCLGGADIVPHTFVAKRVTASKPDSDV